MIQRLFYSVFFIVCIISCGQKTVDLQDFDESAWQADKDGCDGARTKMRDTLIKVKSELKALNGDQIIAVLGKPNKTNLADRNQKYFIYNISCPTKTGEHSTLSIRFSAIGLSYEVLVY